MADITFSCRLAEIDARLRQNVVETKRSKEEQRVSTRKQQRQQQAALEVCFILYVWYCPSADMAMAFATNNKRACQGVLEVSPAMLEDRYMATPNDVLLAIEDRHGDARKVAMEKSAEI